MFLVWAGYIEQIGHRYSFEGAIIKPNNNINNDTMIETKTYEFVISKECYFSSQIEVPTNLEGDEIEDYIKENYIHSEKEFLVEGDEEYIYAFWEQEDN